MTLYDLLFRDSLIFIHEIGTAPQILHLPDVSCHPAYVLLFPFPSLPSDRPAFKATSQEVIDFYASQRAVRIPGVPDFDAKRVLDGQRLLRFLRPLPVTSAGRRFEMRTRVLGVYDKGRPGSVVETQTDLVDAVSGDVYAESVGSAFYVGQGGWGGPKGPASVNYPPPSDRAPDAVFTHQTTAQTALLYRLNGDYNPLHATPEPGRAMGFGGAILHGLYSWNATCLLLLRHLGASDPANLREYQARFASPVRPGDKLVTSAWRSGTVDADGWEEVHFETRVDGGKVCLSNGRALMKVSAEKSKL